MKYLLKVVLIFNLIIFLCACGRKTEENTKLKSVRVIMPQLMLFEDKIRMQGNVEPVRHALICARNEGTIDVMKVEEGDFVRKEQLLFQTDKVQLECALEAVKQDIKVSETKVDEARAHLAICKAQLKKAEMDFKRSELLYSKKAESKDAYERKNLLYQQAALEVDLKQAALEVSNANLEKEKTNLNIARKLYDDSMLKAPFKGVVTHRYLEKGEYASKADKILRLEDSTELEVTLLVSAVYYPRIREDLTEIKLYNLDGEFICDSSVYYKSPTIDSLSRTFEAKIKIPADNSSLVSGMLCQADIIFESRQAYGIPEESLFPREQNKFSVFSVDNGKAVELEVKKGITDKGWVEIKGMKNEKLFPVVYEGQDFLNVGEEVRSLKDKKILIGEK